MKAIITTAISLLISITSFADTLTFYKGSYDDLFKKAKKEKKSVMLYFHFDGCGACKEMEKKVFPDKNVADYFNKNFINYEINTLKGEGKEINKEFNVVMHPTFMFLDKDKKELNKIVGYFGPDEFIAHAKNTFDSDNSLIFYKEKYRKGGFDDNFLYDYCYKMKLAFELNSLLINEYLATQSDEKLKSEKNIKFIYEFALYLNKPVFSTESRYYKFMNEHRDMFTAYFKPDQVEARLFFLAGFEMNTAIAAKDSAAFFRSIEKLKPFDKGINYQLEKMDGGVVFWTTNKYPVISAYIYYYEAMNDTVNYNLNIDQLIIKMWDDEEALNSFAWDFHEKHNNNSNITKALNCARRSVELKPGYANCDTYAWILYKLKKYDEALIQAEKAIGYAKGQNMDYEETEKLISMIKEKK